MKQLAGDGVKNIVATMNAGFIPPEVWVHDLKVGGDVSLVRLVISLIYVRFLQVAKSFRYV